MRTADVPYTTSASGVVPSGSVSSSAASCAMSSCALTMPVRGECRACVMSGDKSGSSARASSPVSSAVGGASAPRRWQCVCSFSRYAASAGVRPTTSFPTSWTLIG